MQAQIITCHDPFRPTTHREVKTIRRRRRIATLAPKTSKPFICIVNGEAVLRKQWKTCVKDGDVVSFIMLPQGGGGGSNPLKIILAITVAVIAPQLGFQLASAFGSSIGAFASTSAFGSFLGGAIGFGLNAVINALIPPPSTPKPQRVAELAAPSPTYSVAAQGNSARLGQPIPVLYGRNVIYPDFIGQPYAEYAGNEQYLYQLFAIGQGQYDIQQIRIEDTVVANDPVQTGALVAANGSFEEIEYQILFNQPVTAFPANVFNSVEVAGQELLQSEFVGPFVVNPAGTLINFIAVDIVLPKGLYYANDNGGLDSRTVSFRADYRAIDDAGSPTGDWLTLTSQSVFRKTTTPQRFSYKTPVANGRYEVRMTRTNAKDTDVRAGNDVNWGSARGYSRGSQNYGEITVLAMKLRATNNLSVQASRKINVICTRKLPIYDGSNWSNPTATRSIAWALADLARSSYGLKLLDNQIDLNGLLNLNTIWNQRGDRFDAIFDSQQPAWEALTQIARCGRGIPFVQGGILNVVRDAAATNAVAMFSQRNIIRNTLQLQYIMPNEETADAIDVEYWDAGTWRPKTVRAALPLSDQNKVSEFNLFGCTNRAHAWREGMYMAAANRFRRRTINFETEMEGFIPSIGDLIAVQHDMPKWGTSGELVDWDSDTLTATLSEPVEFDSGVYYMALRRRDGSVSGPYVITSTTNPKEVIFSENPDIVPDIGNDRERTHFTFGLVDSVYIRARVLGVRPRSLSRVAVYAVVESDFVHTADTGAAPSENAWQLPAVTTIPLIRGLFAVSDFADVEKMFLSWQPAAGADYYVIEVSDSGEGWTRIGETRTANYTAIAPYGNRTQVRVAAVGIVQGPWVEINYGSVAAYMWDADDTTLMWDADDANLMWRY